MIKDTKLMLLFSTLVFSRRDTQVSYSKKYLLRFELRKCDKATIYWVHKNALSPDTGNKLILY